MRHGPGRTVKTRGPPHGHGGRCSRSSSSTAHLLGGGPGRPVKTRRPPYGQGGVTHTKLTSHGHTKLTSHGPRPGPSMFQKMGHGPTQPITFLNFQRPARPGPSIFQNSRPGPAPLITFSNSRPGPARPVKIFRSSRPGSTTHDKP